MVRKVSLEGYDRSLISRALIVLVLIFSILFYILNYDKGGPLDIKNLHGIGSIDTWLRVVFRLSCAYLAIHTALFWMVLNPVPGIMVVLFRESLEVREYPSEGFEKLGTFSSWTLILFGASMLLNGLISIGVGVGAEIPSWLVVSGVSIFATGFGSAALTALVVRHVIIPSMVENGENLDHMFKPHEHVMHNLALILLSIDLVLGGMVVHWTMMSLSLIVGALYLVFAEFWAIKGSGYYVYEFIDTRPRFAPLFLLGLMVVCLISFCIGLAISEIKEDYPLLATFAIVLFLSLSVRFRDPSTR